MKKVLWVLVFLSFFCILIADDGIFLYVPTIEEVSNFVSFHFYLLNLEENYTKVDDANVDYLLENYLGQDFMESLLFENYLRFCSNKDIQNRVLLYFDENNIVNDFSKSLEMQYNSIEKTVETKDGFVTNYVYDDFSAENINYFKFNEVNLFDKSLGLLLLENDWKQLVFKSGENDDEIDEHNSVFFFCGGGTNSMTLKFEKFENVSEDEIESFYKYELLKEKYPDTIRRYEIPIEGDLTRSNIDKFFLLFGYGPEVFPQIDSATINSYLYNEQTRSLYSVQHYINFSDINIHYSQRFRIYTSILMSHMMVFVNTK